MLIGLVGAKGAGKDAFASFLVEEAGFVNVKFAGPLKNMVRSLLTDLGMSASEIERRIEGDLKEEPIPQLMGTTSRWIMQSLGTEWRDLIYREMWTDLLIAGAGDLIRNGYPVVVSDCRFKHEAIALQSMGGVLVRITRPGIEGSVDSHVSELEMKSIEHDVEVLNDGTLKDLQNAVKVLLNDYFRQHHR